MEVNDEDDDCLDDDAFVNYLHGGAFVDSMAVVLAVVVAGQAATGGGGSATE